MVIVVAAQPSSYGWEGLLSTVEARVAFGYASSDSSNKVMCLYCSSDKNTLMLRERRLKCSDEYSKAKKDIIYYILYLVHQ